MITRQIFFQKYSLGKMFFKKKPIKSMVSIVYKTIPERLQEVNLACQTE
jgi:hypothetical protein